MIDSLDGILASISVKVADRGIFSRQEVVKIYSSVAHNFLTEKIKKLSLNNIILVVKQ